MMTAIRIQRASKKFHSRHTNRHFEKFSFTSKIEIMLNFDFDQCYCIKGVQILEKGREIIFSNNFYFFDF